MPGPLTAWFAADHRRLDALLSRSVADPEAFDLETFEAFRAGLLKHIALEEKILLPAVREASGGEPH
ncbi:MAG TPA: hemerythrin domain-containing protein, partial [Anaeromyxobacteraceae bacterium]|nr:hemerythrin domain-containing protein [Anaeromyxobacteraceae bacterium]